MKCTLKDIVKSIQTGPFGSQLHRSDYSDTGIPVIMPQDIVDWQISTDKIVYVSQIHANRLSRHKLEYNDIVYPRRGDVSKCAQIGTEETGWLCGTGCLKVKIDTDKANPQYIFYYLRQPEIGKWIELHSTGATMMNINSSTLNDLPLDIPILGVQNKICSIVSNYDNLIDNCRKQISLLEEAAQRLYKEWFVDFRFPGHESVAIVDGLPEGWIVENLEKITSKFATGLNPRKNFILGNGTNYYITIKNMSDNNIILDDKCDFVDDEALYKINKRSDLKVGDLLFSGIGTIGRVYLIQDEPTNWNISESVFTIRPNNRVSSYFLYLLLLDKSIQTYAQNNAHGCAQKGIRMADLKAFTFNLPTSELLGQFDAYVKPLILSSHNLRKQVNRLIYSRDILLPRLMSGEIEIKA